MSQESLVVKICNCIETLINGKKTDSTSPNKCNTKDKKEALFYELKKNIHFAFEVIEKSDELKADVKQYITICHKKKCKTCDYLNFLELCLVLLKLLSEALLVEENEQASEKTGKASVPKGILSISQQRIVKKCLQFVVALGILPNLLHGIGVPLSRRLEYAKIMENFASDLSRRQKHAQITVCIETLLYCAERSSLQSLILSYHGTDLLAALFQLCHAPIKKIDGKDTSEEYVLKVRPDLHDQYFAVKLPYITDYSSFTEQQIINEVMEDRNHFTPKLEKFLKQLCPSLLLWELFMFQGIPVKKDDSAYTISKVPHWLRKICRQMWTEIILQNHGITLFVQVVLDKAYDVDVHQGKIDNVRLDAIARLIVYNPVVGYVSFEKYIQRLSKQVLDLLQVKGSPMDTILHYVASSIILHVLDRELAEKYFLEILFKPLLMCVSTTGDSEITVSEKELTQCIEDIHKIFVLSSSPLSRKHIKLLFNFFHCFSQMYSFLVDGVSALKLKVKDLMVEILSNASEADAMSLLHDSTFSMLPDGTGNKMFSTTVEFVYGEEGGIYAVQTNKDKDYTLEKSCSSIVKLLKLLTEMKNTNLNRIFFLLVLRKFCSYFNGTLQYGHKKFQNLFSVFLKEFLVWDMDLREALMLNLSEVVDILIDLIDLVLKWEDNNYEEIILMVIVIINTILFGGEELSSAEWAILKKCLPSFEKLVKRPMNSSTSDMVLCHTTYIATHGVGADLMTSYDIIHKYMSNFFLQSSEYQPEEKIEACSQSDGGERIDLDRKVSASSLDASDINDIFGDLSGAGDSEKSSDLASNLEQMLKLNHDLNKKLDEFTSFEKAIQDIKDTAIPIKGHGLIAVGNLLSKRNKVTLQYKRELLEIFKEGLDNDDSYVYLSAIQCLSLLADIDAELVLPTILKVYQNPGEKSTEFVLKTGEVLLKICRLLGDHVYNYRDQLLHTYLVGAKHKDPQIRSSSLSNLGEACMYLKFIINGVWLQEILNCVSSLLKTDKDLEVRRCAVMVITLLIRGVGKDLFQILDGNIKDIYSQLKIVYNTESDEVLRLHSQLALEEINASMKELLFVHQPLIKEIQILHH